MTDEELDQIEARANAATPGPWQMGDPYSVMAVNDGSHPDWHPPHWIPQGRCFGCWRDGEVPERVLTRNPHRPEQTGTYHVHRVAVGSDGWRQITTAEPLCGIVGNYDMESGGVMTTEADAAFIAHAREDVPALVAEVRRLRACLAAFERGIAGGA